MFEYLYEWLRSIAYFMIFVAILMHVIPGQSYRKYIRFFTGILLVLLLMTPVMRLVGMGKDFLSIYNGSAYEEELKKIEDAGAYLENIGDSEGLPEDMETDSGETAGEMSGDRDDEINVEEIRIGQ